LLPRERGLLKSGVSDALSPAVLRNLLLVDLRAGSMAAGGRASK